jgi:L-rhamnonate dehydratase
MADSHKIANVTAYALRIPVDFAVIGSDRKQNNSLVVVTIETESGLIGHGVTGITQGPVVAEAINGAAASAVKGLDARQNEKAWNAMYWTLTPWAQSGTGSHAIAAVDLALWDIKAKLAGEPLWRLMGGARSRVPVYATCGFSFLDDDGLVESMRRMTEAGYWSVKMQVGRPGLDDRKDPPRLAEQIAADLVRVRKVRDTVGPDVEIAIDAGCRLDLPHAVELARNCEELGVTFFEEPIMQNDVLLLAEMRRQTKLKLCAGQNEGLAYRFRDMLLAEAVDVVQPNLIITGGATQCLKIAGMASSFNVPISNGGGCPFHNMHLQAAVTNGTAVEYQVNAVLACEGVYKDLPQPKDGWLDLPETPGFGFEPDIDAVREYAVK